MDRKNNGITTKILSDLVLNDRFIKDSSDLKDVLEYLIPEQHAVVFDAVREQLPSLIKNNSDFNSLLQSCSSKEERTVVFDAVRERLSSLIKDSSDFYNLFKDLTSEQRIAAYTTLKDKIPTFIKNSSDFKIVLEHLTPEQRTDIYLALKDQIPTFIKNSYYFRNVLKHLTPKQRTDVYLVLKEQIPIPPFIYNHYHFKSVLKYLTPEQCTDVCQALKEQIPNFIKNISDLKNLLKYLPYEQCEIVFESLKNQLLSIIQDSSGFGHLLKALPPEQCKLICESLEGQILFFSPEHNHIYHEKYQIVSESKKRYLALLEECIKKHTKLLDPSDTFEPNINVTRWADSIVKPAKEVLMRLKNLVDKDVFDKGKTKLVHFLWQSPDEIKELRDLLTNLDMKNETFKKLHKIISTASKNSKLYSKIASDFYREFLEIFHSPINSNVSEEVCSVRMTC